MNFEKLNQRNEWSGFDKWVNEFTEEHWKPISSYLFGQWIWVRKSDDILPGLQKKYIRGKNPVPLVVWLELREIDSLEYICVIERSFVHHSLDREDWYTRIVKQWIHTEENMILANEFFDGYRKE